MYRLHIDIPFATSEEEAINKSMMIMTLLNIPHVMHNLGVDSINYRLGHDDDRQKSNYLNKNENGHVSNKKSKIDLTSSECPVE